VYGQVALLEVSLVLNLLCGCDRRLEWCCSDVDLAAVVIWVPALFGVA